MQYAEKVKCRQKVQKRGCNLKFRRYNGNCPEGQYDKILEVKKMRFENSGMRCEVMSADGMLMDGKVFTAEKFLGRCDNQYIVASGLEIKNGKGSWYWGHYFDNYGDAHNYFVEAIK